MFQDSQKVKMAIYIDSNETEDSSKSLSERVASMHKLFTKEAYNGLVEKFSTVEDEAVAANLAIIHPVLQAKEWVEHQQNQACGTTLQNLESTLNSHFSSPVSLPLNRNTVLHLHRLQGYSN
ncbi:TPA: hypothetical protein ACH3X1_016318 [Trebouxia sp. C0004]